MRVLIVGAGIAGLVLAAKLRRQGREPIVIERLPEFSDTGYGIGLWPLGSCVLHGLGVYEKVLALGLESRHYELADHCGEVLQRMDLSELSGSTGPMIMLPRACLIDLLRKACGDLSMRFGTTADVLVQTDDAVRVSFSDGTKADFDLVVACDGIHSKVRSQMFSEPEVLDTGWKLWTWWGREGLIPADAVREFWGRGVFFGAYPVRGRCMFVAGLPADTVKVPNDASDAALPVITTSLRELISARGEVRLAVDEAHTLFAWPTIDVRAKEWHSGRVVLCGDAAAAFLRPPAWALPLQ